MKVCIAEKPSVAKEIAQILGAKEKKDGYFEGNGYQVTWTFGHLCTLKEPNEYDPKWKAWSLFSLPIIPARFEIKLIENKGVEKQFSTIEYLVSRAEEVINCGDAGQEGELIQRWVLAKSKFTKPHKRLWISSLTEESIKEGFTKLKDSTAFDKLYYAGSSRAIGDWLLGMNATRLYTSKYGNGKQVLSIGRVQTPTLAMIVNRQLEIDNFVPTTYFEIKTTYREVVFNSIQGKYAVNEEAAQVLLDIQEAEFEIKSIETKKAKEAPPRLFDLTSLQVECNKKFGFSADDTLKTIQTLYEKKFVTYPRVDTTYLSNDIYPKVPAILESMQTYAQFTAPLLGKPIKKSNKVFDDKKVTDHHAIIPTNVTAYGMNMVEEQVYNLIAKRFIAVFYNDCEVSNTAVIGQVKTYDFKANGKQILEPGWRIIYQKEAVNPDDEQEDVQILPAFVQGEKGPHVPGLLEKQTSPPKFYTEATLLRAMETAGKQVEDEELREMLKDNGIGRPSTRAAVIETLFKRNYIRKEKKNLIATITGIELIQTINNELLKSAELTGQWEFKLRQIEKGEYEAKTFLDEMKSMVANLVSEVQQENHKKITAYVPPAEPVKASKKETKEANNDDDITCPSCNKGKIVKGSTAYGCNAYKDGCRFKVMFEYEGKKLTDNQLLTLISKRKTASIVIEIKGEKKSGILKLTDNFEIQFEEQAPKPKKELKVKEGQTCPKCKTGNIIKGNSAFGCSNWKTGCDFRQGF